MKRGLLLSNALVSMLLLVLFLRIEPVVIQANTQSPLVTTSGMIVQAIIDNNDPIRLHGREGLIALAEFVNSGSGVATSGVTFRLRGDDEGDIVDGSGLAPIGWDKGEGDEEFAFHGHFDGSNVTIENLNVIPYNNNNFSENGVGLFGYTIRALIEDVTISGVNIDSNVANVGSLVGLAENSYILGARVLGSISISSNNSGNGGLVGINRSTVISNSFITGVNLSIFGTGNTGGLVGVNSDDSLIINSYISVNELVISGTSNIGGLVGNSSESTISSSFIRSENLSVNGNGSNRGGFIGLLTSNSEITSAYISSTNINLSGGNNVGGFVGTNSALIANSFVATSGLTILAGDRLGGFVGNSTGSIRNSSTNVEALKISGGTELGGFAGNHDENEISSSYVAAKILIISGTLADIGGFVGLNGDTDALTTIRDSFLATSGLYINSTDSNVGGFVGTNGRGGIINSYLIGNDIDLVGSSRVGYFIGRNRRATASVTDSFLITNNSQIEFDYAGAILENSSITNSGIFQLGSSKWYSLFSRTGSNVPLHVGVIDGDYMLSLNNSGLSPQAYRLVNLTQASNYFPILIESGVINLADQSHVKIYWLAISQSEEPSLPAPSPSSSTPVLRNPSVGEPYTYDPVFLTIEVDSTSIEVGEAFKLSYRGFSTFGPIIRDYTDDVVVTGTVNPNVVGSYTLTLSLTAEDLTITRQVTIQVVDTTPPVISGPTSIRLFVNEVYEPQLTVIDNVDANVSLTPLTTLDPSSAKTQDVIWQATDASGNVSTFTQTVTVVVPKVRVEEVTVGTQRFIFPVSEAEFDLSAVKVEYVVSTTEPTTSSNWQVYTMEPSLNPGERVFIRLTDGTNTTEVRQTIARPQEVVTVQPVVIPDIEPTTNTLGIVTGTVIGLGAAGAAGWWFLVGKKKFKSE